MIYEPTGTIIVTIKTSARFPRSRMAGNLSRQAQEKSQKRSSQSAMADVMELEAARRKPSWVIMVNGFECLP